MDLKAAGKNQRLFTAQAYRPNSMVSPINGRRNRKPAFSKVLWRLVPFVQELRCLLQEKRRVLVMRRMISVRVNNQ